jgi:hypothetical protein
MDTSNLDDLISRPPVIRAQLSQCLKEAAYLRRLLKLSEAIALERHNHKMEASRSRNGHSVTPNA